MLLLLGEAAFGSHYIGLMKGFLEKVTLCSSQNSLDYAVGANKPKFQCLSMTNVYFSHRLCVQNGWIGKFNDPRHQRLHLDVLLWSLQHWEERVANYVLAFRVSLFEANSLISNGGL